MKTLDLLTIGLYLALMVFVGITIRRRVNTSHDFFTAGGKMPWWLAGISHHMSGYSAAVFVAYASLAYTEGLSVYIWWACSIAIAILLGADIFAVRWVKLRIWTGMVSPLEYLAERYGEKTKLLLACSGSFLKAFDVGAKWAAAALLFEMFVKVDVLYGTMLIGGVTLIYCTTGGLWADAATDLSQFAIQLASGIIMCVAVLRRLGGAAAIRGIWNDLPPSRHQLFHGQYTFGFAVTFVFINLLSYNGGTWSLAQRFMASPDPESARRSALLSAILYIVWPVVLFYPMWAAPLLLPGLQDPSKSYALLAQTLLPAGLLGLALVGLLAHSMAMVSSDANAVSAVIVRDIVPKIVPEEWLNSEHKQLLAGRLCTVVFLGGSIVIAVEASHMGGVLGIILLWYRALVGPVAVPMLLGMLPWFLYCGSASAVAAWLAGIAAFVILHWSIAPGLGEHAGSLMVSVAGPALVSLMVYSVTGICWPADNPRARALLTKLR